MNLFARRCLLAALPALVAGAVQAQNAAKNADDGVLDLAQPLTLERALQVGLRRQDNIAIAGSQLAAAQARVTQARSSYYPQVAPSFQYSSQLTTVSTSFAGTHTGTVEQHTTQIGLSQLLYDSGKREENAAISRSSARAAVYNILDTRQSVLVNITTSYYDLLRQKELVRVAGSNEQRARTTLEATRAYAEAGTIAGKDVLQAEADADNARVQVIQAQNNGRLAQTTLKNAMGILSPLPVVTPDTHLAPPPAEPETKTEAEYLQTAFANRPDLKRSTENIEANRRSVRLAQIGAGVQVSSSLTEGYRVNPDTGQNRALTAGITYPLFDAGAARAVVREANETLEQARLQLDLTRQQVQLDVEQAYLQREEAQSRYGAAQTAMRSARLNYDAARESQKEGVSTIVDVITAQSLLVTAETNAVQAIYDYYTADARLRRAVGGNDPYRTGGTPK